MKADFTQWKTKGFIEGSKDAPSSLGCLVNICSHPYNLTTLPWKKKGDLFCHFNTSIARSRRLQAARMDLCMIDLIRQIGKFQPPASDLLFECFNCLIAKF